VFFADCQVRFEVLPSRVQSTFGVFDPVSGSDASNRLNRYSRVIDGTGEFAGSKFDVRLQFRADPAAHRSDTNVGHRKGQWRCDASFDVATQDSSHPRRFSAPGRLRDRRILQVSSDSGARTESALSRSVADEE
jgi:hypothetical protein